MLGIWQADATQSLPHENLTLPVAAAGTPEGQFVDLYRWYYPRLVRALLLAGATSEAAAEDAAQEAFARTFRHWKKVRTGTNPRGYVATAAFRVLRRRRGLPVMPLAEGIALVVDGPEDDVVLAADVEQALASMPPRRRACAALCIYLEVPVEDAAAALGIAASTVRVQLHRARADLHAALGQRVPE